MPPARKSQQAPQASSGPLGRLKTAITALTSLQFWKAFLFDPGSVSLMACLLLCVEVVLNIFVIERVRYTEIDWRAYMQEVEGVLNGTFDYSQLKGDTGPLVYPAGFVYVYMVLYYATQQGRNIKIAQYIFFLLYIIMLMLVFRIYVKSKKIPPFVLFLSIITSYRVHSIFVLRLFNDPIAMILLYAAINLFMDGHWTKGSLAFSAAVSVKMNILLFAPALLILYLTSLGLRGTVVQISICAALQLVLGLPFLLSNPFAYIVGAFNIGRVFMYQWTVNWRFIPEEIFVNRGFHIALLGLHVFLIALFLPEWITYLKSFARLRQVQKDLYSKQQAKPESKKKNIPQKEVDMSVTSRLLLLPLFTANLIGIACARSLHYQFYVWYYHTLPYLVWSCPFTVPMRLSLLGVLELCWNTYPSTDLSSAGIHVCHLFLLIGLFCNKFQGRQPEPDPTAAGNQ
ncbi:lethal(2)neighbour of Tid protein [Thrips palmi]|uniref:dolichyl-P-Man:Man5GlcNAc2-PP-dolichol alpha-1,3-mannosyltransferase n=1 Tax=Thrips palmi TaxID=161013 RepID=A0A6P9ACA8_THRPL|nr:lethal(2)neighbour of Tid protein [Thrips palmi]